MNSVSPLLSWSVLSQSPARWGFLVVLLLWLCAVMGCDGFQRSVCERQSLPTCQPGALPGLAPAPFPTPSSERHFEWRAELPRSSSRSLVGLVGRQVGMSDLILPSEIDVRYYGLDIGNQDATKRITLGRSRVLHTKGFVRDPLFTVNTESDYYVFDQIGIIAKFDISEGYPVDLLNSCRISRDFVRPFAHQQIDALAASCDNGSVVGLFPASAGRAFTVDVAFRVDAVTVADWTDRDLGRTLIVLGGNSVRLIGQLDGRSEGKEWGALKEQLESVLYRRKGGLGPVTAAYVADVNADHSSDMVFAQAGSVWALSYRGANRASPGEAFVAWPERLVDLPAGETVQALLLAELDGDEFPDMVIETDRAVRLYRSVAGRL